jgi:hypothetical protein
MSVIEGKPDITHQLRAAVRDGCSNVAYWRISGLVVLKLSCSPFDPEPTYASRGRALGRRAIHELIPDFGLGFNASRKEVSLYRQSAPNVSWQLS